MGDNAEDRDARREGEPGDAEAGPGGAGREELLRAKRSVARVRAWAGRKLDQRKMRGLD